MALFGGALLRPALGVARRALARGPQRRCAGGMAKIPDQNKAYLFNEVPGQHHSEGWEAIWYATIASSAVMFWFVAQKPESGIEHWALDEAAARNKVEARGGELKYGVIYSNEPLMRFRKTDNGMPEAVEDGDEGAEEEEE